MMHMRLHIIKSHVSAMSFRNEVEVDNDAESTLATPLVDQ